MKLVLKLLHFFTLPLAVYLVYRLVTTDGYERNDYIVMFILFSLLLLGRILGWSQSQNSEMDKKG